MSPEQNFLEEYVLEVLKQAGFDHLSADAKAELLPQFVAEAERRIGAALLPKLNQQTAAEFLSLMDKGELSPQKWWNFWNQNVPDFPALVKSVLNDYAAELKSALPQG